MFIFFYVINIYRTQYVVMFMSHPHAKFNTFSSITSLISAIKPKAK
jgi:hypothetical protein